MNLCFLILSAIEISSFVNSEILKCSDTLSEIWVKLKRNHSIQSGIEYCVSVKHRYQTNSLFILQSKSAEI